MWQYNSFLNHAEATPDYKYIAKVTKDGKTRYFYSREEYDRYLYGIDEVKKSESKQKITGVSDFIRKIPSVRLIESAAEKFVKAVDFVAEVGTVVLNEVSYLFKPEQPLPDAWVKDPETDEWVQYKDLVPNKPETNPSKTKEDHKYVQKIKLPNGKTRYFYDELEYQRYMDKLKYQENEPPFMEDVPDTADLIDENAPVLTEDMDMEEINEKYDLGIEYQMNCMNCTTAYELRQRGYDVEAAANPNGYTLNDLFDWYDDPEIYSVPRPDFGYDGSDIESVLIEASGPDSRGNLIVSWEGGGGHSMVYEVDSNGNVTIRDCQINEVVNINLLADNITELYTVRTDNLELKEGVLDIVNEN